jgi:hypothetical protein
MESAEIMVFYMIKVLIDKKLSNLIGRNAKIT